MLKYFLVLIFILLTKSILIGQINKPDLVSRTDYGITDDVKIASKYFYDDLPEIKRNRRLALRYVFNRKGKIIQYYSKFINGRISEVTFEYNEDDIRSSMTSKIVKNGKETEIKLNYSYYDENNSYFLISENDSISRINYLKDDNNNVVRFSQVNSDSTVVDIIDFEYDKFGRMSTRISQMTNSEILETKFKYYIHGRLKKTIFRNSLGHTYTTRYHYFRNEYVKRLHKKGRFIKIRRSKTEKFLKFDKFGNINEEYVIRKEGIFGRITESLVEWEYEYF